VVTFESPYAWIQSRPLAENSEKPASGMNTAHATGGFSLSPVINTIGGKEPGTRPAKRRIEPVIGFPLHVNLR